MEAISVLALHYGFKVIEDASHAIGSSYQGKNVGVCEFSDICIFSFHPVKIITSAEGGMATTQDAKLAQEMALYRSHGITKNSDVMLRPDEGDWYYEQHRLGFNYRMTDLCAALGLSQSSFISDFVKQRNLLSEVYQLELSDLALEPVRPLANSFSAYHLQIILLAPSIDRKAVFNAMRAKGIMVHVHYFPVHLQPYYLGLGFKKGDFLGAEQFYDHCLTLPLYPDLSTEQQAFVIQTLKEVL
jgi:dTDP-4-amino-4,6-dideoxygalactose transaminase